MVIKDFEGIFAHIGGFGRYQMFLFAINCYMCIIISFVYYGQFFMTLTPPHWCAAPPDLASLNLTSDEVKGLTIPKDPLSGEFERCRRYDVDFVQLVQNGTKQPNTSWPTTNCSHGWTYNYSMYYPTITSQLDWVCSDDWRPTLAQSLFFVGSLVGSPVLGWAADAWGRLPVAVATNVVGGIAGVASAFCTSFAPFVALRFIVGITFDTHYNAIYILLMEYVGSKYRSLMSNGPILVFLTASMCAMPWLGFLFRDWATFTLVIHAPQLLCIFFYWLLPESARWLLGQGRVEDTMKILKRAAKVNGKTLSPQTLQELQDFGTKNADASRAKITVLDLLKTPVLRRRFLLLCISTITLSIAYDAHMRNTEHIGPNVFVTFTIAGLVELPADLLTIVMMEKVGRRHTMVWTVALSGVACLAVAAIPAGEVLAVLVLAMVGRFLITMAGNCSLQYKLEILPTVARAQGMAFIHTVGFLAAFVSPYVVYLSKFGHFLPYSILGVVTVLGGIVCLFLPETLGERLPDSLEDGESFFVGQSCCYNPCARYKNVPTSEEPVATPLQGCKTSESSS